MEFLVAELTYGNCPHELIYGNAALCGELCRLEFSPTHLLAPPAPWHRESLPATCCLGYTPNPCI